MADILIKGMEMPKRCFDCPCLNDECRYKPTNADKVRAMTDEELADWYWWMLKHVQGYTDSRVALTEWLKEEAEDGSPTV